jgi:hypothetical protein
MQPVQQVRLGLEFFRRVVVEIDMAGEEIFRRIRESPSNWPTSNCVNLRDR